MATIIDDEAWLCVDCGIVVANGDYSGCEDEAQLRELMAAESELNPGYRVVSGCPEGEECEFATDTCDDCEFWGRDDCPGETHTHRCRFDREFSSARCDGCGTYLAGYRYAAVIFAT